MVLTEKNANKEFGTDTDKFMVLNTREFQYTSTKITFGYNIEILNLIRELNTINKICAGLKAETSFDTSIFHLAIDKLFSEESFSESELLEYFKVTKLVYGFIDSISAIADLDYFKLPLIIDLLLLGIPGDTLANLDEVKEDDLHNDYCDLLIGFLDNKFEYEDFIKQSKALVSSI
jgi:hypothetical protein